MALHCLSVKVLAVPLLLQQRAHLQDQDFVCPSLVQSSAVSAGAALVDQWWGWAAPEDSCSGEHTLGNMLFLPLYFDRSPTALHVLQEPGTGGLEGKSMSLLSYLMLPTFAFS